MNKNTLPIFQIDAFTSNGQGKEAVFSIKIDEYGEASITIVNGGNSFTENEIITVSNIKLGDNRIRSPLNNGNFESGSDSWIIGVDENTTVPTETNNGNKYYSENVLVAGTAYSVNLSQKLEIIEGNS